MRLDARIPVRIVVRGGPGCDLPGSTDTVLLKIGETADDGPVWAAADVLPERAIADHGDSCRCCAGRSPLPDWLGTAFIRRARSDIPWFGRVHILVGQAGVHQVVTMFRNDPLLFSRYRLDPA